jgi:Protein of unknown function (DUF2863)
MKETRASRTLRERKGQLNPDAEKLVTGALGLANSGSRSEDQYWERLLNQRLEKLLEHGHNQPVFDAVERLHQTEQEAYGALIEAVENCAESAVIEHEGQLWDVVLISIPIVAWTRFKIPCGPIVSKDIEQIALSYHQELLAKQAKLSLVPYVFSIDQLPREFSELRKLTRKLGLAAVTNFPAKAELKDLPETTQMLADSRYVIGAVATPLQQALFRWQELDTPAHVSRVQALERWVAKVRPTMQNILLGCGFECLLPDAYHINLRESDRRVRPHAISAGIHFLKNALDIESAQIKASIASFGADSVDEYRIGLIVGDSLEVAQGVVWPLYGPETEMQEPTALEAIREQLRDCGVTDIRVWPELMEPEYCEDCAAPMYPNIRGDIVHLELPEEGEMINEQFH